MKRTTYVDGGPLGIHSCNFYCDLPECVKSQRDFFRDKYEKDQAIVATAETMGRAVSQLRVVNAELMKALQDIARQPEGDEQSAQAIAREVLAKVGASNGS